MKSLKRRTHYVIDTKFQIKYIFYFLFIALGITLLFSVWSYYYINLHIDTLLTNNIIKSPEAVLLLNLQKDYLYMSILKIFIVVALGSSIISIFITHKLAGPMFSLKRKISSIIANKEEIITELRTRKSDEFKDVVAQFNNLIRYINQIKREK